MSRSRGRKGRPQTYYASQQTQQPQDGSQPPIIRGEVINLGDMGGTERPPVTASFGYFGQNVRVNPGLTEIVVMDFFEEAEKVKQNDPHAMAIVKQFARDTVHPDDWDRFWALHKEHGQDSNDLMTLVFKVLEGVTARPKGQQSASSAGPTVTRNASPVTSSPPDADQSRREAFLRQIQRFEAQGTGNGAAMAAQVVAIAMGQGIDLEADPTRGQGQLVSPTG